MHSQPPAVAAITHDLMRAEGISRTEAELRLFYAAAIGAGDVSADTLSQIIDIEVARRSLDDAHEAERPDHAEPDEAAPLDGR